MTLKRFRCHFVDFNFDVEAEDEQQAARLARDLCRSRSHSLTYRPCLLSVEELPSGPKNEATGNG